VGQNPPPAVKPVLLIVDASLPGAAARDAFARATDDWGEAFGIAFRIDEEVPVTLDAEVDLPQRLHAARRAAAREGRIVVAVSGGGPDADDRHGYSLDFIPALLAVWQGPEATALVLRHELGHVFGLPHLPGRQIMAAADDRRVPDFDELSRVYLRAAAGFDPADEVPLLGVDLDVMTDVYTIWARDGYGHPTYLRIASHRLFAKGRVEEAELLQTFARVQAGEAP
jgi:hypothetical protein